MMFLTLKEKNPCEHLQYQEKIQVLWLCMKIINSDSTKSTLKNHALKERLTISLLMSILILHKNNSPISRPIHYIQNK